MSQKIEELQALVESESTVKMKELLVLAKNYIEGLNNIFKTREVTESVLKTFDFPMFLRELEEQGLFENKNPMVVKLMTMNVLFIVRHVWEFTDENGVLKTGDDLHNAWPLMFSDEEMMSVSDLYREMYYI